MTVRGTSRKRKNIFPAKLRGSLGMEALIGSPALARLRLGRRQVLPTRNGVT